MGTEIAGFKGRFGERIWRTELDHESSDSLVSFLSAADNSFHVLSASLETRRVAITQLAVGTGVIVKEAGLPAPWLVAMETSCIVLGGVALCLDPKSQTLYHGSGDRFIRTDLEVRFRTLFRTALGHVETCPDS